MGDFNTNATRTVNPINSTRIFIAVILTHPCEKRGLARLADKLFIEPKARLRPCLSLLFAPAALTPLQPGDSFRGEVSVAPIKDASPPPEVGT